MFIVAFQMRSLIEGEQTQKSLREEMGQVRGEQLGFPVVEDPLDGLAMITSV